MCDASDSVVGAVLGKRKNKVFHTIYYVSRTLNDVVFLAVVFAFNKFRHHLVLYKVVFSDHSAIKFLLSKQDAKPRVI